MRTYRAVTLVLMIVFALVLLGVMTTYGIATFSSGSLVALGVVVAVAAAAAGVAFSYRRYRGGHPSDRGKR